MLSYRWEVGAPTSPAAAAAGQKKKKFDQSRNTKTTTSTPDSPKMPAPTALRKSLDDSTPSSVPLPPPAQDEEILLDTDEVENGVGQIAIVPLKDGEDEVMMDEEGRPRFDPIQETVSRRNRRRSMVAVELSLIIT